MKRKKIHKKKSSIKLAFNGFNLIMLQANFHFFYIYTIFFQSPHIQWNAITFHHSSLSYKAGGTLGGTLFL